MSTVISQASADLTTIVTRIDKVNEYLEAAEELLNFDGKLLEAIQKQHPKNVYGVCRLLNEMKALEEFMETKLKEIESVHWKRYNENHGRALSTRDIQAYIAGEDDYKAAREIQLEIVYVKRQLESIYEALKDMGWSISHVTKLRIAELEQVIV